MSVQPTQIVHVVLIKATRYDDDGYPMRHWRGVLPSNTLACLVSLEPHCGHSTAFVVGGAMP